MEQWKGFKGENGNIQLTHVILSNEIIQNIQVMIVS